MSNQKTYGDLQLLLAGSRLESEGRESMIQALDWRDEKIKAIANNAIYFDDSSDYRSALYDICKELQMCDGDIGVSFIEEKEFNERA